MNETPEEREARWAAAAQRHAEWLARVTSIVASTRCPRCKAEPGQPCVWGVTNTGNVHEPRATAARKGAV